jgi:hypothetical protein
MPTNRERQIERDNLIKEANDKLDKVLEMLDALAENAGIEFEEGEEE